jgi:hypothetical protein
MTEVMAISFPQPAHMPCSECGASIARVEMDRHACDEERRLHYQLFQLREEIAAFDAELAGYLASPRGKFETWYAAWRRLRDQA